MDKDKEIELLRFKNAALRRDLRQSHIFNVIFASLLVILMFAFTKEVTASEPQYIRCSNGTEVILIALPGMCPAGYWQI